MRSITLKGLTDCPVKVMMLTPRDGRRVGLSSDDGTHGYCETLESINFDNGEESASRYRIHIAILASAVCAGHIAHEMAHAAFSWCRIFHADRFENGFWDKEWMQDHKDSLEDPGDPMQCPEELYCYAMSNLVAEFWDVFWRRGYNELDMFKKENV